MTNSEYEKLVSEYHQKFEFVPNLDLPIRIKNFILYDEDPLHQKALVADCDGFLNAKEKPSLISNYDRFLSELNPRVKSALKDLAKIEEEITASPWNFKKLHKERLSILADCKVTFEQDDKACWKAAYKTVPVKGGWETFSRLYKMGYGIFIVSAAREKAVKRFGRIKFGIPESQIVGTSYVFKNGYLTDEITEENEFVFYCNKPKYMEQLLFRYSCFPALGMTDDPVGDRPFIQAGFDLVLIASEKEIDYGKEILYIPKLRDNLKNALNPILAKERATLVSKLIPPEELLKIIEISQDVIIKGKKFLETRTDFEKRKQEFLLSAKELFSLENLPFPILKYGVRDKMIELRALSEEEDCRRIAENLIEGIKKYLVEWKLSRTSYFRKLKKIVRSSFHKR